MKHFKISFLKMILFVCISGCGSNDYKVIQSSSESAKETPAAVLRPSEHLGRQEKNQSPVASISQPPAETSKKTKMKRNPFLSREEEQSLSEAPKPVVPEKKDVVLDSLKLSAIFYSSVPSRSYAVVDGRIVREKDSIGGKELTRIKQEEIILQDQSAEYIVRLNPVKNKNKARGE